MASMEKIKSRNILRSRIKHNLRAYKKTPKHIDTTKSLSNYGLVQCENDNGKTLSPLEFFDLRMKDIWRLNRKTGIVIAFEWIITLPEEITDFDDELKFFSALREYLCDCYGEKNLMSLEIHKDEKTPHAHALLIPTVKNDKQSNLRPQLEKLSAKELLNIAHIGNWHKNFQSFLDGKDIVCQVQTGITKSNGGNKSVRELKLETRIRSLERELEREREYNRSLEYGVGYEE